MKSSLEQSRKEHFCSPLINAIEMGSPTVFTTLNLAPLLPKRFHFLRFPIQPQT